MNKKLLVIGIAIIFLLTSTTSISAFSTKTEISTLETSSFGEWDKTLGGANTDRGFSVRQTSDGGYIITGATYSFGTGGGLPDIWLIKTDSDGEMEWDKTFGDDGYDWGWCVQQTTDGGYILLGAGGNMDKGRLIKTDSDGNQLWESRFSGVPRFVQQTSDGGYIVSGHVGGDDILLIKFDSMGDEQWRKTFSGGFMTSYIGYCVQQTSDGGYVTIGGKTVGLKEYCWLIKTDSNGEMEWDKTFTDKPGRGLSVEQTTDGGYIIGGDTADHEYLLIKTDTTGNKEWFRTFGGKENDTGWYAQQTTDGGYMIIGQAEVSGAGEEDMWLIKTDSSGKKLWHKFFGGGGDEFSHSAQQTIDGGYIITGATDSYGAGMDDVWLVKMSAFENQRPNYITLTGPSSGKVGESYDYTFTATDPDGEDVCYWIEWGDGAVDEWIGPYDSGESIVVSHTWSKRWKYNIRVKAEDIYGGESDWATLQVTMPRNRAIQTPFLNFLQSHPSMFPILRQLLGL